MTVERKPWMWTRRVVKVVGAQSTGVVLVVVVVQW
jgi:hypothetical protein